MSRRDFKVDFIGIGSGKCGSTWFYNNLVRHPEICDTNLKELNYFSDLYDQHPFHWYKSQFAGCEGSRIRGEFSVTYLGHPLAAARIRQHFPLVKIMAIIRDPVKRTFSNYLHSVRKGEIPETVQFSQYVDNEANLKSGLYFEQLKAYFSLFRRDQILVIILEEFLRDVAGGYNQVYKFLDVEDPRFLSPAWDRPQNEARSYRFLWIEKFLVRSYYTLSRHGYTKLVKVILDSGIGERIRRLNADHRQVPTLDEPSRARLRTYFGSANRQLGDLLGQPLPWT